MKRDGGLVADIVAELIGWIFSFGMLLGPTWAGSGSRPGSRYRQNIDRPSAYWLPWP